MKKLMFLMVFALISFMISATSIVANAETTNPGSDPADDMEIGKNVSAANVSAPGCTKCQMYQRKLRLLDKTAAQPRSGSSDSGNSSGGAKGNDGAQ
ncbi:hypothetical protein [Bdellovibrio sp. HCB288]|uniref:hypothetical protein n=1 Tax=Bdellovibrio sp. HCB288 TaxID=3394355 RepID=UPI0039B508D0